MVLFVVRLKVPLFRNFIINFNINIAKQFTLKIIPKMDYVFLFKILISMLKATEFFPVERFAILGDENSLINFAGNFQFSFSGNVLTSYIVCSRYEIKAFPILKIKLNFFHK